MIDAKLCGCTAGAASDVVQGLDQRDKKYSVCTITQSLSMAIDLGCKGMRITVCIALRVVHPIRHKTKCASWGFTRLKDSLGVDQHNIYTLGVHTLYAAGTLLLTAAAGYL